ncbi:MAG TPA: polysaccharide deacetylase family protein [Fluviicola sp.]|nr:polysaccharide deacetylase family protein [Fluviicola sp.]
MTVTGTRLRLKWALLSAVDLFGFPLKLKGRKGEVQVICFHGICPDTDQLINGRFYHRTKFRTLVSEMQRHFHIISLDDFLFNRLSTEKLNVLITFDDGYRNNLTPALPVLEELQLPATIFVTGRTDLPLWADLLDVAAAYPSESQEMLQQAMSIAGMKNPKELKAWIPLQPKAVVMEMNQKLSELPAPLLEKTRVFRELLSDDDLRTMQEHPMVSLANHGANHLSLVTLSDEETAQEIDEVRTRLTNIGSPYASVFAYPFGHHNPESVKRLTELGITHQFVSENSSAPGVTERMTVNPFISVKNMLRIIQKGTF